MRQSVGRLGLALALMGVPSVVAAQHEMSMAHMQQHEIGVDIIGFYQRLSLNGTSSNQILLATPVDVRAGFRSGDKLTIEPRFAFAYHSKGNSNGGAAYEFTPDLNVTWGFQSSLKGPYFTAGAGLLMAHDLSTDTQFGLNAGLGTRVPYESGAIRLEAFAQYFLKNTSKLLPNQLNIGARIGLSLWH